MALNRTQAQIFGSMSKERGMEVDEYISTYSMQYIGKEVAGREVLTEEEAESWITKAFIDSLG